MTSVVDTLDLAFDAYTRGDMAQGKAQLSLAIAMEPVFQEVAGLITPIRNYASRLLMDEQREPLRAVRFMEALLANAPESLNELANFRNTEMAAVWADAAFRAYALGQMALVRRAVWQAVRRQPGFLTNKGLLSIWFEAWLGQGAATTFRDAQPGALARRITLWRREAILDRYHKTQPVRKLHVGSGGFKLPGWLNSDLSIFNRGGIVYIDATQRLPFDDKTLDFLFCEHFIEHLSYAHGRFFLAECARVLKPGGVCRLATPDLQFLVQVYLDKQGQYEDYARARFDKWVGGPVFTRGLVLNNAFHNWGHQYLYDLETLSGVLMSVGFGTVTQCVIGESDFAELRGLERHGAISDPEFNNLETMVLEAKK